MHAGAAYALGHVLQCLSSARTIDSDHYIARDLPRHASVSRYRRWFRAYARLHRRAPGRAPGQRIRPSLVATHRTTHTSSTTRRVTQAAVDEVIVLNDFCHVQGGAS